MRLLVTAILLCLFSQPGFSQFKGLIINEFSQGDQGSREYIELLVAGTRTCNDSTADIRGWIVDDQNGWYGITNAANGHYRFRDIPNWAAVPFGSIILLYNSAANQKNLSITAADDPTDSNKDLAYLLPINANSFLEEHDNEPTNNAGPIYSYPPAGSGSGYSGTSNTWVAHISLNNSGGDVLSVISRNKRDSAFFSIGYGYTINPGFRFPTVNLADVSGGKNAALTDSNYTIASKWNIDNVPNAETPGAPNGGVNSHWINEMRTSPKPLLTYTTACSNGPYSFFNQTFLTTGAYTVFANNNKGCIDTNQLYVVVKRLEIIDTSGCDSLFYKGIKFTTNTTIIDHIPSVVINCDSIVRTVNITIRKRSNTFIKACAGIGQQYVFNSIPLSTSGNYQATLANSKGCDSIINLSLVVASLQKITLVGCNSVAFDGITYFANAILYDTIKSISGCDSIIKEITIQVHRSKTTDLTACVNAGDTFNFNGQLITTTGLYTANLTTVTNCDSLVRLYIVFKKTTTANFTACDSASVNNQIYYQSVTFNDTLKSIITGCDSLVTTTYLTVNSTKVVNLLACAYHSYNFFGQDLTTGGNYSHTISTEAGCDSIISLSLVITQVQSQNINGCDSVIFDGRRYYSSAILSDTIKSVITSCDSIIRIVNINVQAVKHTYTTACVGKGNTFVFNGMVLSATGNYTTTYSMPVCDSIVHLFLLVTEHDTLNVLGCDTVIHNGITYTSSTILHHSILSIISSCDSIITTTNINVNSSINQNIFACIAEGASYLFDGQTLTASGHYTAQYSTNQCDSIVHLFLTVAASRIQSISGCDSVLFNGQYHYTSKQFIDTILSVVTQCDSLYIFTRLIINTVSTNYTTLCLATGGTYDLNGQSLSQTGQYATTYSRPGLCDSIVHLYLVICNQQVSFVSGCGQVFYNGTNFTTSTTVYDTIKSVVTNCDSLIQITKIQVNPKPQINISDNVVICKGDSVQLTANASSGTISWIGFGTNNSIKVSPALNTTYTAIASDANDCINNAMVTVFVEDFSLNLSLSPNPVLEGNNALLQTTSILPYNIQEWTPVNLFHNQKLKTQQLKADTSLTISVAGRSNGGCLDTVYARLVVTPFDDIYIPSGFTPNGDGKNETITVRGSGIKELDFKIFNRWGQLLFATTDKYKEWDGRLAGILQPAGTYVYVLVVKKINGRIITKKGTITSIY